MEPPRPDNSQCHQAQEFLQCSSRAPGSSPGWRAGYALRVVPAWQWTWAGPAWPASSWRPAWPAWPAWPAAGGLCWSPGANLEPPWQWTAQTALTAGRDTGRVPLLERAHPGRPLQHVRWLAALTSKPLCSLVLNFSNTTNIYFRWPLALARM